tara:strand:- start:1520 stop:1732 length:213 start_codon:yes stop_codon:yes gene_type:complete
MVVLRENPIEEYYNENAGKNLSLKKVSKKLNMKFRKAVFLAHNSELLKKVNPVEVGSLKRDMLVFRFEEI